jgi:hypothetical protein
MNSETTPHDRSPEAAIGALRQHDGPVLLDLDETLYLRNSTEDFIDSARPAVLALLLMRLLDFVKPWRWTGGEATRDVWRVRSISMCFPTTLRRWKNRVAELARNFTNLRLMDALQPRTSPIIATSGFHPIVEPLVRALGLPQAQIVAARMSTFDDRRDGKLKLALDALGDDTVRRALVLTDSAQDLTLLDACALPLRTVWPEAGLRHALSGVYLPGQYLSRVKRPGTRYIVRGIVQEDFALWVLSSIGLALLPLLHVVGLTLLAISFWSIYELGYVDNDRMAARFEADPKLSAAFHDAPVATPRLLPWLWASAAGVVAIVLLRWPQQPLPIDFAAWTAVLLATHGWFMMYNRFDKGTRVWMFAGLQFARGAAFTALVAIPPVATIAIGAHVLAKWVPYCFYRLGGRDWPDAPVHLIRLLFFAVLAPLLGAASGFSALLNWTTGALLAWMVFRARREIATAWRGVMRIDHADTKTP